jgi:hypothetical protein
MSEQPEIPDSDDLPEDDDTTGTPPTEGWQYRGSGSRSYPHRKHPGTGHVLSASPGDVFDFGEEMPPDDGLWYDVSSGEPYDSSPAGTGAGETEE